MILYICKYIICEVTSIPCKGSGSFRRTGKHTERGPLVIRIKIMTFNQKGQNLVYMYISMSSMKKIQMEENEFCYRLTITFLYGLRNI